MDLATLITTDHTIFDGAQTVTLKNPAGTSSDSVAYVTAGPVAFKALQLIGGGLVDNSQLLAFSLPASLCSFAPIDSATITDPDGVVWRVLSVDKKTFDNRYVCNCVRDKAELSAPLQIAAPTVTGGAYSVVLTWTEVSGGTNYRIEASLSSSFTSPTVATGTLASIVSGTTATKTVTIPSTGTWYVRVRRSNALGDSPWSDVQTATVVGVAEEFEVVVDGSDTASGTFDVGGTTYNFSVDNGLFVSVDIPTGYTVTSGGVSNSSRVVFTATATGAKPDAFILTGEEHATITVLTQGS